ncbi:YdhK family protein [Robertmurraya sp. FSL W8-0741]|uniref:YdhK family protein n=1 Tax=Robertmurraya TaxID=2837507 RepID=UPI0010F7B85D|nr:YdhK family protein [Robertmurraya siralis]
MFKKLNGKWTIFLLAAFIFILGACSNGGDDEAVEGDDETAPTEQSTGGDHSHMEMSGTGEVPEGLVDEENPTYEVGSKVIIEADHMEGMMGAEATVSGAYHTTVYAISYTPTTGGERVENHKWVIHEELVNPGDAPLAPGTEVKTDAVHMAGMEDATATIDSAEETTVYMVDFTTPSGEEVKFHKWVTEDELSPAE